MKLKKLSIILVGILSAVFVSFNFSCSTSFVKITENIKRTGRSIFTKQKDSLEVIFFDNDNVVNEEGLSYYRPARKVSNTLGSSDCYMIRSGDCEVLVDAGYQTMTSYGGVNSNYEYNDESVTLECKENLLKKIASYISSDGILDYLIVTHADYDHIASLIVKGGIFDAFQNKAIIESIDGTSVQFTKINNIIDFDSGLVRHFSDESIDKEKRLIDSSYYLSYIHKRDMLIEKGTNYCPAASFFDKEILKQKNIELDNDNRNIAMPDEIEKLLGNENKPSDIEYILTESFENDVNSKKNSSFKDDLLLSKENGSIKEIESSDGGKRYYYSLKFGDAELRILYNWHYDFLYRHKFSSQDRNNICVCIEVVKDNFKYLGLGDLGGNGENGLIKYYKDTEVLKDVTLFKSSHHGSTNNLENSSLLFKIANPKIVVATCCAIWNYPSWESETDPILTAIKSRTKITKTLFDNILGDDNSNTPYVLFTNITCERNGDDGRHYFESQPFYGDINISYKDNEAQLSYSYIGKINPYISRVWNSKYFEENGNEFNFYTRQNDKILSVYQTDWYKKLIEE